MKKIIDYLQNIGLSETEAKLYESLLKIGPSTIKELSVYININRITVHFNIENLIEKGLIGQSRIGARRKIFVEPPKRLKYLIEQKLENFKIIKDKFPDILDTINSIYFSKIKESQNIEVKYYVGKKEVELIYKDVLSAKEVRSYVNLDIVASVFPENVELFVKGLDKNRDLNIWEIVENSKTAEENTAIFARNKRYHFKIAYSSIKLSAADVMIYSNKVAVVNVSKHASGMIFISKDYYDISKEIFDFVWRMIPDKKQMQKTR